MNKRTTYTVFLAMLLSMLVGCQLHTRLTTAERDRVALAVQNYCMQGSAAIDKNNDIVTAQRMFLLATQLPGAEELAPTAGAFEGLAFTESCQNKLEQAAQHFRKSISIYEAPPRGPMNPALVRPLTSLGRVYHQQHRDADAKAALSRAVQIASSAGPNVNTDQYMRSLLELGIVYLNDGELLQAEALLRRALDLRKFEPQPNEQRITEVINNLALVLEREGRRQEAQALRASRTL